MLRQYGILLILSAVVSQNLLEPSIKVSFQKYQVTSYVDLTSLTIIFRIPPNISVPESADFVVYCNQLQLKNPVVVTSDSGISGTLSALASAGVLRITRLSDSKIPASTSITMNAQLSGILLLEYNLCNSSISVSAGKRVIAQVAGVCIQLPDIPGIWTVADPDTIPQAGNGLVNIQGVGFQPFRAYSCVFSNGSIDVPVPAYYQSLTALICYSPRWESSGPAALRVRLGLPAGSTVDLLRPDGSAQAPVLVTSAAWISLLPTGISAVGGAFTIVGTGFDPTVKYTVAFDAAFVSPAIPCAVTSSVALLCLSPAQPFEGVSLLRIAAQDFTVAKIGGPMTLRFLAEWNSCVGPSAGSVTGGDVVTLVGAGFIAAGAVSFPRAVYFCRWEGAEQTNFTAAAVLDSGRVRCVTPSWARAEFTATVVLYSRPDGDPAPLIPADRVPFTGAAASATFDYLAAWQMPALASAPAAGGLSLTVRGAGFHPNRTYGCRLVCAEPWCLSAWADSSPSSPVDPGTLTCTTPAWALFPAPPAAAALQASLAVFRAAAGSGPALLAPMNPVPQLRFVITRATWAPGGEVWTGPWRGGVLLTLTGTGLCYAGGGASGCERNAYRCRFSAGNRTAEAGQCVVGADAGRPCAAAVDCAAGACSSVVTWGTPAARIINDSAISCAVPQWPFGEAQARVFLVDATFASPVVVGEVGAPALYHFTASFVDAVTPTAAPLSSATTVTISGSFVASDRYQCRFGLAGLVKLTGANFLSPSRLSCTLPRWGPYISEADAAPFEVLTMANVTVPVVQPLRLRYFAQWDGLGPCPGSSSSRSTSGSSCGQQQLKVRGWGLAPPPAQYRLRFQDQETGGNSLLADLVNVTNTTNPQYFGAGCQGGPYAALAGWPFPAAVTRVTLEHSGSRTSVPESIVPLLSGQAGVSFQFLQISDAIVGVSTDVRCSPPCWPVSITVAACGLVSGPTTQITVGAYVLQSHTDWICRLYGLRDGQQISSFLVTVESPQTLVCVLNPVDPNHTVQSYRLSVLHKGTPIGWSTSDVSRQEAVLNEVWTRMECANSDCVLPSSGGSSITIRGFAFSASVAYRCAFSLGNKYLAVVNATMQSRNTLFCLSPDWNFTEGWVNVSVLKSENNVSQEVAFAAIPTFKRQLRFYSVWWSIDFQQASVLGGGLFKVYGRGFDPENAQYVAIFRGDGVNGPLSTQTILTSALNVFQIDFIAPEFHGFEGNVSVTIIKNQDGMITTIQSDIGTSLAHPLAEVISTLLYAAVITEVRVEPFRSGGNATTCFPLQDTPCWGVAGLLLTVTSIFFARR